MVSSFDEAAERYGIEKIKTIGDSYMAVCGLSVPYLDHDKRAIDFALEMLKIVRRFNHERGFQLNVSVGINSGDTVAGIVGKNKFIYDVWGDTINIASAKSAFHTVAKTIDPPINTKNSRNRSISNLGTLERQVSPLACSNKTALSKLRAA